MTKNTLPSTTITRYYDIETKTVTSSGNSGAVYLPKEWIGCKVQVLLLERCEKEDDKGD